MKTALLILSMALRAAVADDFATLKANAITVILPSAQDLPVLQRVDAEVDALPSMLNASGLFPDVNYDDPDDRSEWLTALHLQRCLMMATAASSNHSRHFANATVIAAGKLCSRTWAQHNWISSNWWWQSFGVPHLVAKSLLLLPDDETLALANAAIFGLNGFNFTATTVGANTVWSSMINVLIGCVNSNVSYVDKAFEYLQTALVVVPSTASPKDGIQQDYSFHQHGPLAYFSFGYGSHATSNLLTAEIMASGTNWSLVNTPAWETLVSYIANGQRYVSRGAMWHEGALGRHIVYYSSRDPFGVANGHYHYYAAYAAFALAFPSFDGVLTLPLSVLYYPLLSHFFGSNGGEQLQAFAAQIEAADGSGGVVGHRRFYMTDYSVHHRPGVSFSLHTFSNRTLNTECVNAEAFQNRPVADGMLLTYRTGTEYSNIYPVWRWSLLPGTTEVQVGNAYTCDNAQITDAAERLPFNGGVSDSFNGAACFDVNRTDGGHTVRARKSWFFFEDTVIALGAGIASDSEVHVTTSLEQRNLDASSPVLYKLDNGSDPAVLAYNSTVNETSVQWVWHSSTMYAQLPASSGSGAWGAGSYASVQAMPQGGSWSSIVEGLNDTQPLSLPTFLHFIHHGIVTKESAGSYSYAVVGNVSQSAVMDGSAPAALLSSVSVVANTAAQQAVCFEKVNATLQWALQAVFWPEYADAVSAPAQMEPVRAESCGAVSVVVSRPSLVFVTLSLDGATLSVVASDPMKEVRAAAVGVTISGLHFSSVSGNGCVAGSIAGTVDVQVLLPAGTGASSEVVSCALH
jgi:chondroitin AC lyase